MAKVYPFGSDRVARTEAGGPGEIIGESRQVASDLWFAAAHAGPMAYAAGGLENPLGQP